MIVISGSNFGSGRADSYVEIAGSRITGSGYLEWSDEQIKIILPSNIRDGLVHVATNAGTSNAGFFANEATIPIAVRSDPRLSLPAIDTVTPSAASVGDVISITGTNFGTSRNKAQVFFSADRGSPLPADAEEIAGYIPASDTDYDYEYWTDTEVHVHVPDGADSGMLFIKTDKGASEYQAFTVRHPAGQRSYTSPRTYVLHIDMDILTQDVVDTAFITLYLPRPALSSLQPAAVLRETSPEPLITDDRFDIIHQVRLPPHTVQRIHFSQDFIVGVYASASGVNRRSVSRSSGPSRSLYTMYTAADKCVPATDSRITALAAAITGSERNPYSQAQHIYGYMQDTYAIQSALRDGTADPVDLLEQKRGDAYDFAIVYTALCRAAGIPALPVAGVLVGEHSRTYSHWWSEIYFEQYGWFPVDPALGAGLEYASVTAVDNPRDYYFGSLDNQHIAFSRGWKDIKPAIFNGKTVRRPRTFALQSIWEESSKTATDYSSLWNEPAVIGIY